MKRQLGFTLLEVMIAASIMSMGIVAALELFGGSMNLAGEADRQSKATVLANALIDEELWRDVLEDTERSGSEGQFDWRVATHPIQRELRSREEMDQADLHDATGEIGLWLIQAEVRWQAPLGEKSILLETARMGEVEGDLAF